MLPKLLTIFTLLTLAASQCQPCFYPDRNQNCDQQSNPFVLHMNVHPHLDAFWIYDFDTYYQLKSDNGYEDARGYFESNRFSPVKDIFDTALRVLEKSRRYREQAGPKSQKARRMFFNSEMGFFKHWYTHLNQEKQRLVKDLLKSGYWEIVGGGFVEHDEGCAYYEDIIDNFELGLHFLKNNLNYIPKVAISADSFGHSQSTAAILAHLGIEGFFVQRSDQHILVENKTQFIWRAKSHSNNLTYGTVATHIRWAIHGYEDQFTEMVEQAPPCEEKEQFIENLRRENRFLRQLVKSQHVMRYFGHDFQEFQEYQYEVIEGFMEQFSREKCENVVALYTTPTDYFKIYISEVIGKQKTAAYREEDIFPIWDYDSGLFWTGYYTTDPYHKKFYRDCGRFLHAARKAFALSYIQSPNSTANLNAYSTLEQFAETVAYLQHHDGISGTSKYIVMDQYQIKAQKLYKQIIKTILPQTFENFYPLYTNNPLLTCGLGQNCVVPDGLQGDVLVKVFNSGSRMAIQPIVVHLPQEKFYKADCKFETICMCVSAPCACQLYLYPDVFTFTEILLKKIEVPQTPYYLKQISSDHPQFPFNKTHIKIKTANGPIEIGYKRVQSESTLRTYEHLSRYGQKNARAFYINSGKYALGNNPNKTSSLSAIRKVYLVKSPMLTKILILWHRQQMKTIIESSFCIKNSYKVTTLSSAQTPTLSDLYLQFTSSIKNENKFYTDSNGWLVMKRELYKHEDYKGFYSPDGMDAINGNSYPMTAFAYIQDSMMRMVVNTDRPQGVISLQQGRIWVNFDRLTSDDGKWVYETTHRSEYQKFTHQITLHSLQNPNHNEAARKIQQAHDQPLLIQLNQLQPNTKYEKISKSVEQRNRWAELTGIEGTKFWLRVWNDSTVTLRVQNVFDDVSVKVGLFDDKLSTFLSAYFGNGVYFESMKETSMGGNMLYEEFLNNKWNWNRVVDVQKDNQIFNKVFSPRIGLRPLQIRTFTLSNLKLDKCPEIDKLGLRNPETVYRQDIKKEFPGRSKQNIEIESTLVEFLKNGDHCEGESPVLYRKLYGDKEVDYASVDMVLGNPDHQIKKEEKKVYSEQMSAEDPHKNKENIYGPISKLKDKPVTYIPEKKPEPPKKETKEQSTSPTIKQLSKQPADPQIQQIGQKIRKYHRLSASQKEKYFHHKKQRVQTYLSTQK